MKFFATGLLGVFLTSAISPTADAQTKRPGRPSRSGFLQRLKSADKNKDGKITKEEAKTLGRFFSRIFARADRNRDGVLDKKELKMLTERFGRRGQGRPGRNGTRAGELTKVGGKAPDFKLKSIDGKSEIHLASFTGKKPVAIIFGSYT